VIEPRSGSRKRRPVTRRLRSASSWKEEIENGRVKAKAMKRKFGGVGLGYEDQPGAMELGALGEPM
jgi:hypothetical protein